MGSRLGSKEGLCMQETPSVLGLMLCFCCPEILSFRTGDPHFDFAVGPANYIASADRQRFRQQGSPGPGGSAPGDLARPAFNFALHSFLHGVGVSSPLSHLPGSVLGPGQLTMSGHTQQASTPWETGEHQREAPPHLRSLWLRMRRSKHPCGQGCLEEMLG